MTWHIKTAEGWRPWVAAVPVCSNSNDLQGVHRSDPLDVIQAYLAKRRERFLLANGEQNMTTKQQYFSGHTFLDKGHQPMVGAYGETL